MNRKFVDMFVYILIFLLCAGGATFAHYFPPTAHVPRPAGHAHRKYNTSFTQTLHVMKANSFILLLPAALLQNVSSGALRVSVVPQEEKV